ncbi:uncharacterized protein Nmlp_2931 [Natronomonas moolapensis 8.8.11]|jgi:hypothetical protein|uniref:Uncharacterized protein n=1 Tax=Natronomonas moolapensis (strain DSM 18674 / CECT 7526 / JCM 14361 / 8.8.11) TaxID=268739 RepID=M1XS16_NATM8|nr:DUF5821 family protein [Natronomonas moolapensis]CCQ37081.1 uncharacterized protein Nmlp_2931 [Natronomonas moolapensis 8.8.11]
MSAPEASNIGVAAMRSLLTDATDPLYVLRPAPATLELLVQAADADAPLLHILASKDDLRTVRRRFRLASSIAELSSQDQLTLTAATPAGRGTVLVTDETAHSIAHIDNERLLFEASSTPESLLEACRQHHKAESFDLRTPAWGKVSETLVESFNTDVKNDFRFAIQEWTKTVDEPVLDTPEIALLVAGTHDLLFDDLLRWGEELSLASKETFNRVKTAWVENGILTSEKVPIGGGRSQLRLTLTDEYAALSTVELLNKANEVVACRGNIAY